MSAYPGRGMKPVNPMVDPELWCPCGRHMRGTAYRCPSCLDELAKKLGGDITAARLAVTLADRKEYLDHIQNNICRGQE
jgi:hypothetical protein